MCVLFALFAYLQKNDLGQYQTELWWGWLAVYAASSGISLLSYFRALPRKLYVFLCLSCVSASLYRFSDLTPGEQIFTNPDNPAGNEGGGLMIIAIWLATLAWTRKAKMPKTTSL